MKIIRQEKLLDDASAMLLFFIDFDLLRNSYGKIFYLGLLSYVLQCDKLHDRTFWQRFYQTFTNVF